MKINDWLEKVKQNKDSLYDIISCYHPANLSAYNETDPLSDNITAPNAERACEVVRNLIRKENVFENPGAVFNVALQNGDYETINKLLSSTWFGVPESTSCWGINGFSVMVDLLDDPPENEEEYTCMPMAFAKKCPQCGEDTFLSSEFGKCLKCMSKEKK